MEQLLLDDKPPNYRLNANVLSTITFWWTFKLFKLGSKRDLFESDLPEPLPEHEAARLGEKISRLWYKEYSKAKAKQNTPSLIKVLAKCFLGQYLYFGTYLAFQELLLKPLQPLCIGLLVRYFTTDNSKNTNPEAFPMYFNRIFYYNYPNQTAIQTKEALVYGTGVVVISTIGVFIQHPYMIAVMHLGMKIRVACMSLMYRKTLRMSMFALSPITVGNVVNLMSNDVTRFDMVPMFINYLWISPLQVILFIIILQAHVEYSGLIGISVVFIFIPVQLMLAYINKSLRWKTAYKTDERVRLMNEIIMGIQVIKMYGWEHAFCKLIHHARRQEMSILVKTSYIRGMIMSMIMFTARCGVFFTLLAYSLLGNNITSEKVFIVTGYYILLRQCLTLYFPQGVIQFAETLITIRRTRDYMMNEDAIVGDPAVLNPASKDTDKTSDNYSSDSSIDSIMYQESLAPVVPGIKMIEVFAKWRHIKRYVLRDINLTIDKAELIVLIGEVGAGKSSLLYVLLKELPVCAGYVSIKGTVSYASQEPWLFAGSVRQNILFGHEYIRDRYRRVCRVCALSKDFRMLPYGDQTVVGERGISLSGGQRARVNLARCIYKQADIYMLDDPLSAVDTHVGAQIFQECITNFLRNKIRVLVTHQLQYLQTVDKVVIMEKGKVLAIGTYRELQSSGLNFTQYFAKPPPPKDTDKEPEEIQLDNRQYNRQKSILSQLSVTEGFVDTFVVRASMLETRALGNVGGQVYKQYCRSAGNWTFIGFVISMFLITQGLASGSDYFVAQWVEIEEYKINLEKKEEGESMWSSLDCIIGYSVLTQLLIMFSLFRSFIFFFACLRASIKLHNDMFESIVFGYMRFFNINPSGRILNRFSKDMGSVDEDLPYAMIDFFQMFLNLIGVFVVLCITHYILLVPTFLIIVGILLQRKYYLKTSRSVKRIEGVVRSPVYAHLNASIQGLITIRSHNAEEVLTYEFDRHQDLHSSAWFFFISTSRAFSLWTDLLCVVLIFIGTFSYLLFRDVFGMDVRPGDVGLGVTQCITLTALIPWGMRQSAEMENQMTSVERIIDFTSIEQEPSLHSRKDKKPEKNWPDQGKIVFQEMYLAYSPHEQPVLKDINITIHAKEKIGIVGRTGAGKSSMISALFRLAFIEGKIIIDEVNILEIGLHDLRKKISIIPQEPVIFTGTLRFNLDPFREYSDETLLSALSDVDLESSKRSVLNRSLTEGGADFSAGQRQLLCLARAIVRNCRILILDEATANVDPHTDHLIQRTIRAKFAHCTVLTIAHRLHTIMDSDRVLVMNGGVVVEFDHPHMLLQDNNGFFNSLVNQTGKATAGVLRRTAEDNFNREHRPLDDPDDEHDNDHHEHHNDHDDLDEYDDHGEIN